MRDNLKKKFGITDEEFDDAVNQIKLGKIVCDGAVLAAVVDLLCRGDIPAPHKEDKGEKV